MILRVFNKDLPLRTLIFVLGEGILIYVGVLVSAVLCVGVPEQIFGSTAVLGKAFLITLVFQLCLHFNDLYDIRVTDSYIELGLRLTRAIGVASIILGLAYLAFPILLIGEGTFFVSLLFLVFLVVSWRYAYHWMLKRKMLTDKVLILGSGKLSKTIVDEINSRPDSGYQIAGVVSMTSSPSEQIPETIPQFTLNGDLWRMVESRQVRKIVIAMDDRRGKLPLEELLHCRTNGVPVLEGQSFYEKLAGRILAENINPSSFIFSEGFRKSKTTRFFKRCAGFVFAAVCSLITLPFTILIAIAIKLDSRGPVFYKQVRCGERDRAFELWKFRTMVDNAEAFSGPTWAQENDSRVTRVGKLLRKYRLDEVPQMWNVLKGDMSFVGPRPERPEFVQSLKEIIPYYSERHTVRPGITGWAQVSYRYGSSVQDALEKLKYDLFYIKNMSIILDLVVIFRTIKIVLHRSGAR
jgi:sugar transferase (PEP-CTERM system associated)